MKLCLLLALVGLSTGALFEGTTPAVPRGLLFLGKFVFDVQEDGLDPRIAYKLQVDSHHVGDIAYQGWGVWLYSDEDNSWPMVYPKWDDITCDEARQYAKEATTRTRVDFDGNGVYTNHFNITQKLRPRYWFVVLANCNAGGLPAGVEYEVHFTNEARSAWSKELGYNVMGINTMYLVIFLLFFPFTCVHIYGMITLRKKLQFVHPLLKVFTLIIIIQLFVILCNLSYWGAYWHNGKGLPGARPIGEIGDIIARVAFMLVLILLAKGWTISGEELTQKRLILGSLIGFGLVFVLILIWKDLVTDDAATDSPVVIRVFIYILMIAWLVFAAWFAYCIRHSYVHEDNPVKKALYRNLGIVFTPWFFGYPLVYLFAIWIAAYKKDIIIETFAVVVSFVGYAILSFMLWPSRAEEFFNISTPDVQKSNVDNYEQL